MPKSPYCDKTVAYIDRANDDEIIEIDDVDVLPRRGEPVSFREGDAKGQWEVFDVKPIDSEVFAALVYMDRKM